MIYVWINLCKSELDNRFEPMFGGVKIDSEDVKLMLTCLATHSRVELILSPELI